jgi:hypothetical protein
MKKISLIILFVVFSVIKIYSQEKQNDATWNETINFLEDNLRLIKGKIIFSNIFKTETIETTLSFDKSSITVKNISRSDNLSTKDNRSLNLLDLSSAKLTKGDGYSYIMLLPRINGLVKCEEEYGFSACNFIEIGINSEELKQRTLKAFKHLAYLSNERYAEKKAKSKF